MSAFCLPDDRFRAREHRLHHEMCRLYRLSDRWLAEDVLRRVRDVRADLPNRSSPDSDEIDAGMLWHLLPEAAHRLGIPEDRFREGERSHDVTRHLNMEQLRVITGLALQVSDLRDLGLKQWLRAGKPPVESAADVLGNYVTDGNPIVMMLDRLHPAPPAGAEKNDWIARHMRRHSASLGYEPTPSWTPEMHACLQTRRAQHDAGIEVASGSPNPGDSLDRDLLIPRQSVRRSRPKDMNADADPAADTHGSPKVDDVKTDNVIDFTGPSS